MLKSLPIILLIQNETPSQNVKSQDKSVLGRALVIKILSKQKELF